MANFVCDDQKNITVITSKSLNRWTRHAGVTAWRTDKALLQAQCAARDVVPPLFAAGQAWRLRHRQTASCKNVWTIKITDCKISQFVYILLFGPLCL